jgi:arylsulfatase A-like enzyme
VDQRLPIRSGMYGMPGVTAPKVIRDNAAQGLPPGEITIAALLKARGYATAIIGKWHLGHLPAFLPTAQGFDEWFGLPFSHDMRMTAPRDNGWKTAAYYAPKPIDGRGRLHERQWTVAAIRSARRIRRTVTRRQGDDVGGRRADAGDLLVAGDGAPGRRHRHRVGHGSVRHVGRSCGRGPAVGSRHRRREPPRGAHRPGAEPAPRTPVLLGQRAAAIRKDRFKAHFVTSSAYGIGDARVEHAPPLLFDLAADPGERENVAAAHPDVTADLQREAAAHRRRAVPGPPLFDGLLTVR